MMGTDSGVAKFVTRTTCRVCGSAALDEVLDYGPMPLAGGFHHAGEATQRYPLKLVSCRVCTLIQVAETVDPEAIFAEYSYAASVNRTLVKHFERLAGIIHSLAGSDGLVVEFGCNDGVLLNPLERLGCRVLGVDPSDVSQSASERGGWPLFKGYFGVDAAAEIREGHGLAKVVVANNVCAHVDDPNELIAGVCGLLADDGRFIFEVHYQGDLIEKNQFDTVYHEHTCYYSLRSLEMLLSRHGLTIIDVERIPIHSGSIRVTAAHTAAGVSVAECVGAMLVSEQRLDLGAFAERCVAVRAVLHRVLSDLSKSRRVVAYGASGRATVLLNFCGLGTEIIENVSDLSPLRVGRFVPGTSTPIVPRTEFHQNPPEYALMTAWNYEPEIVENEVGYRNAGGVFIIPLPEVRLV